MRNITKIGFLLQMKLFLKITKKAAKQTKPEVKVDDTHEIGFNMLIRLLEIKRIPLEKID